MGEFDTELKQDSVQPFLDFSYVFDLRLFGSDSCQHNTGSLLIKSLDHLNRVIFSQVVKTDRGNSGSVNVVAVLVSCDGLKNAALK